MAARLRRLLAVLTPFVIAALLALGISAYRWRDLLTPPPAPVPGPGPVVMAQLNRQLPQLDFDGVAFTDVIDFLRDVSSANIFVNWRALEAAGVDRDAPVSMELYNVPLHKVLSVLLDSIATSDGPLEYSIDDGVITISTAPPYSGNLRTKSYNVGDLLAVPAGHPAAARRILDEVTAEVAPESWIDNGGHAGEIEVEEWTGHLVVTQTPRNHYAVEDALAWMRYRRQLWRFAGRASLVAAPFILAAAILRVAVILRGVRRRRRGLCGACGYDLRGIADRCPECGAPVPAGTAAPQPRGVVPA